MRRSRQEVSEEKRQEIERRREAPAKTPEGRDQQMISYAYDLVEQRLLDGTASAQETVHFLRLASEKTRLEVEKLKSETAMLESKKKVLDASEQAAIEYSKVLDALKLYQGRRDD